MKSKGFSLIELLVVMVIMSLVTSLLAVGLSATTRNFERLNTRSLINNHSNLSLVWLRESIFDAVQYHPESPVFSGTSNSLSFISASAPDAANGQATHLIWSLKKQGDSTFLSYASAFSTEINFTKMNSNSYFEYFSNQKWGAAFVPTAAALPDAIRLIENERVVMFAHLRKPGLAVVPAEMAAFGAYEFGQSDDTF